MSDAQNPLAALETDGVLLRVEGRYRTTRGWQSAMVRAASRLYASGDGGEDLRVPIASALVELYGDALSDAELAIRTEALLPVETAELNPPAPGTGGGVREKQGG